MKVFASIVYWLLGWQALDLSGRLEQATPVKKFIMIVAPHTSNWDFFYALWARYLLGYGHNTRFLAKHTLFRPPFGWFFYWLGGTPVIRNRSNDLVAQCIAKFADAEELGIVIAPEGTRRYTAEWKSGFYHIATGAGVPIIPVAMDYAKKTTSILPVFYPTGNMEADIKALRCSLNHVSAYTPAHYHYLP
jgi:1-acyl-sn-glycerol-3-phosphate acyltransferase